MNDSAASGLAAFGLIGTLFLLILAILWILVPFAIFGIKPLLRDLFHEQRRTNEALLHLQKQVAAFAMQMRDTPPPSADTPTAIEPVPAEDTRTLTEIMQGEKKP